MDTMDDGWTKGPIVRVRCMNDRCKKNRQVQVIRMPRMGGVLNWVNPVCASCLSGMQIVNRKLHVDDDGGV